MAKVRLERVYKRYGDNEVVTDVSLDIEDGDFVVLVGPSGCGKSTTLRMIAGLEALSAGNLYIGDQLVNSLSPRDRDVAMVFQSYALYPHMSVYENMCFGLKLRKMDKAEIDKRVRDAAQILELTDYLERKPKALSGGQRQRVAMGRAIVRQPAVFLFDEPLSNLDAKLRVQMRTEIAKLHQRLGTTTVYVTHDQVEAMTLAKHIVVMSDGIVQQMGAPLEVYRNPANTFVGGFIGSPAMNFYDVERLDSGRVKGQGFELNLPAHLVSALAGETAQRWKLGVRPEHMFESKDGTGIPMHIDVIEPLGADVFVLGESAGVNITARLEPDTQVKEGQDIWLGVETAMLHLFEAESGQSLMAKAGGA
jgi:multiple sugar transport system ATP-binding protein